MRVAMELAMQAVANADVKNSKLMALIGRLVDDDPFLPDSSKRRDDAVWCFYCCGEDREHTADCPWVEARALLGK